MGKINLKRASAGSGKTYTLTKIFLEELLSEKTDGKTRQLRAKETLPQALREIMAVTFTVKATNEMKSRIVKSLAEVAAGIDSKGKEPDYLKKFHEEWKRAEKVDIQELAREALKILLMNYSDFRVQTIDAFFQSILHTFAYEASLDDNFNLEIDTDYLSLVGMDASLDAMTYPADGTRDGETVYWLKKMIKEKQNGNKWNVFARLEGTNSLYSDLIKRAGELNKEQYHFIRDELAKYFQTSPEPFRQIVEGIEKKMDSLITLPLKNLYDKRAEEAQRIKENLESLGLEFVDIYDRKGGRVRESLNKFDLRKVLDLKRVAFRRKNELGWSMRGKEEKVEKIRETANTDPATAAILGALDSSYESWIDADLALIDKLEELGKEKKVFYTWDAYRKLFPQFMMVLDIAARKRAFLQTMNALEISDTAQILSRIIGEDETPFVYERMGSRLSHYLIDEFQDTSKLQWNNLRPLLSESIGRDGDNLIIGDAKQSIYRFRNADYELISKRLEEEFPGAVEVAKEENTNYRSLGKIVKFNNYIFSKISDFESTKGDRFSDTIKTVYQDVRQKVVKEDLGYVNIKTYNSVPKETIERYEKVENELSLAEPGFVELPALIMRLRDRGYTFNEIAVLVNRNKEAQACVKSITRHNLENAGNADKQINIISKENLLVSSALSVKIVIYALEMLARGRRNEQERQKFMLEEPVDEEKLFSLVGKLQSPALPSLVEAILGELVPKEQRDADTSFLAAFQDAVIDYSTTNSSDIGTFLKWWARKSDSLSINSPEDSDGVRIVTIHSSKGLEFGCVIIPFFNTKFEPGTFPEWKWVKPSTTIPDYDRLPPYVPVATESSLSETFHSDVMTQYCEEVALDNLNRMYVGFTRPKYELYVYVKSTKSKFSSFEMMTQFLRDGKIESEAGEEEIVIKTYEDSPEATGMVEYTYGKELTKKQIQAQRDERKRGTETISDYHVNTEVRVLKFKDGNDLKKRKEEKNEDPDDLDPRSEGTLKHRILQMMNTADDLDRALKIVKITGKVSDSQLRLWGEELKVVMATTPEAREWFAPGMRVLNERSLVQKGEETLRPDRIVLTPDNEAIIVDYKFGDKEESKNKSQIAEYKSKLFSTGHFSHVRAYLWYVKIGKVVEV